MNSNDLLTTLYYLIHDKSLYLSNKLNNNNLYSNIINKIFINLSLFNRNELFYISGFLVSLKDKFENDNYIIGLNNYNIFVKKLDNKIKDLKINMKKIKNNMFEKIPHYFTRINNINNVYDIIPHCFVEKSVTRNNLIQLDEKKLIKLYNVFFEFKSILRKSYYYYLLYVNDLILINQYVKTQIIKMELARYCKMSGTALDCIIHFYMNCYINNEKEINNYVSYMNDLQLDEISIELMNINYLEKYHKSYNYNFYNK